MKDYKEIFDVEVRCWCLGLSKSNEKIDTQVLHRVIKEFAPILLEAIENNFAFDIIDTAKKFIVASHCRISEREIAFHLLSMMPNPSSLSFDQQMIFSEIVENLEKRYAGAFDRIEKKWKTEPKKITPKAIINDSFLGLHFPSNK